MTQTIKAGDIINSTLKQSTPVVSQVVASVTKTVLNSKVVSTVTHAQGTISSPDDVIILSEAKHNGQQIWVVEQ